MNNLHRELAPISESAWKEIEDEATRSFKRNSAGGGWSTSTARSASTPRR